MNSVLISPRCLHLAFTSLWIWTVTSSFAQTNFVRIKSFGFPQRTGVEPTCLVEGSDRNLYGATQFEFGLGGVIFKVDRAGGNYSVLHRFDSVENGYSPGSLLEGKDGVLFGICAVGGLKLQNGGDGTVFRLSKDGVGFLTLHQFDGDRLDGYSPNGIIEGSDGALYGTTRYGGPNRDQWGNFPGTVFRLNKDGTAYRILHSFGPLVDGAFPVAGLCEGRDGRLYGVTEIGGHKSDEHPEGNGVVFSLNKDGSNFVVMHRFAAGLWSSPLGDLMEGSDEALYGMMAAGDEIAIYKLRKDGGGFQTLARLPMLAFANSTKLLEGPDGMLYGGYATDSYHIIGSPPPFGTIFKLNPNGGDYQRLRGLTSSEAWGLTSLILSTDGSFYGTSRNGGSGGLGALFRFHEPTADYSVLRSFSGTAEDGAGPTAIIQAQDRVLYGATERGGSRNAGILYALGTDGSGYTQLHQFGAPDEGNGSNPVGPLVEGSDGALYGFTWEGGLLDPDWPSLDRLGTLFTVRKDGRDYRVIHRFVGGAQKRPLTLLEARDGRLYGTADEDWDYTRQIPEPRHGVLYRLERDGSAYTVLKDFTSVAPEGQPWPKGLIEGSDGNLYGITRESIYKIGKDGAGYLILKDAVRAGGLVEATDGMLYGFTGRTLFRLKKDGSDYLVLHTFGFEGAFVNLIQAPNAFLYGTAYIGDGEPRDVVFRIRTDGSDYMVLRQFSGQNGDGGIYVGNNIVIASDGAIYGPASGGDLSQGIVFKLFSGAPAIHLKISPPEAASVFIQASGGSLGTPFELQTMTDLNTGAWQPLQSSAFNIEGKWEYRQRADDRLRMYRISLPQ